MRSVSTIRSASSRKIFRNSQFFGIKTISSVVQFSSHDSHSTSDEQISETGKSEDIGDQYLELNSSRVLEFLKKLKKEPIYAVSFFAQLREQRFRPDLRTYVAMLWIFCYCGMDRKLRSVLREVITLKREGLGFDVWDVFDALVEGVNAVGLKLFSRVLDAMIKAFASESMFGEATKFLYEIKKRGFGISIFSLNYLMNRLIECGDADRAILIYNHLEKLGLTPNVYTYGIVVKAFCRKRNFEEALTVFSKLGKAPNICTFTILLEGLCSQGLSVSGYNILLARRRDNLTIDACAYAVVIRGFVKEKKLKEAEHLLLDMNEDGPMPDECCYGAIIQGYCQAGDYIEALDLHSKMTSRNIKTNCKIASFILQCLCQLGKFKEVKSQFGHFQKSGIYLDKVVYNIVIDALCKLGKVDMAMTKLNEMKGKGIVPDVVTYTTLINGCILNGKLFEAADLLKNMEQNELKPDLITCDVLAGAFSRNGGLDGALKVLNFMGSQGIEPSYITFNVIIKKLFAIGKVRESERFFDCLEIKDERNYSAMIDGYCESNNTEKACDLFVWLLGLGIAVNRSSRLKLLDTLVMEGEHDKVVMMSDALLYSGDGPSQKLFTKVISALCSFGKMKKAHLVFDSLIPYGFNRDVIIYTIMLNGYCKVNHLKEASALFNDMKERGIAPDITAYTVLLDGSSKSNIVWQKMSGSKGERISTSSLLADMSKLGLEGDVASYTALIDSHCKTGNLEEAITLFNEMIDLHLAPNIKTYTALLNGYSKSRHVKKDVTINGLTFKRKVRNDKTTYTLHHQGILTAKIEQFRT
ncbi:OLC1v1002065C1 [Oldenlandia corymbosa var. corymbosa]|uniref:OLC1v1002065C1 n=1 Tax=Oldenlandia corymbosa var. corymbosa TaxID=529605 RepID=A0AAV1D988_OLDCO|nr:OLC1v1002065C1 [Oldenlandia corymbosa var. corymbosa]